MKAVLTTSVFILALTACVEKTVSPLESTASTPLMEEAKAAGLSLYGETLDFSELYENNVAICGSVTKGNRHQRFIYVRKRFLLEERSPSAEWEVNWLTECDRT